MQNFYEENMRKCFNLALKGRGQVEPNPLVGCVLVDKNGVILTSGYHKKYGENHAERNALIDYNGIIPNDATLFVNLEPCSHYGKTPPCAGLIIEKGIKNVVIGMIDPNPIVSHNGIKKLKNAGIKVITGILENEAKNLNKVFIKNILTKKPYIMLKAATTLDGKIATTTGDSKWITGEIARKRVMELRSEYDAILTGSGTIMADNPSLTARIENGKNPTRLILDRSGKIPLDKNIFKDDGTKIFVITNSDKKYPRHIQKINFKDFNELFKELYLQNIYKIMVEAGSILNGALVAAKEVDEINQFLAPKILGGGHGFIEGLEIKNISNCVMLKDLKTKTFGDDILISGKFVYDREGDSSL